MKVKRIGKVEKWDGEKEIKIVATVFTPCIYAYCKNDLPTYGRLRRKDGSGLKPFNSFNKLTHRKEVNN